MVPHKCASSYDVFISRHQIIRIICIHRNYRSLIDDLQQRVNNNGLSLNSGDNNVPVGKQPNFSYFCQILFVWPHLFWIFNSTSL